VFFFMFLDYSVTLTFCKHPATEGNLLARSFMETYGIAAGLTIFDLLISVPVYVILCFDSQLIEHAGKYSAVTEFVIDLAFGWSIAGAHFNGATSWLWDASGVTRQALGFFVYEAIALPSFHPFLRLNYLWSLPKLNIAKRREQ